MLKIAIIGCGAIGTSVLELLQSDSNLCVAWVVTVPHARDQAQQAVSRFAPGAQLLEQLGSSDRPDLVVECAGHSAIAAHVLPALERGIPCVVASVGATNEGLVES